MLLHALKGYADIFNPNKLGSKFFLQVTYPRLFVASISLAIMGVLFIKLQGLHLSMKEIAILSQISALSVLLIPLLSKLKMKKLVILITLAEILEILVILMFYFNVLEVKAFLYLLILSEVFMLLTYNNFNALVQSYEVRKTSSNSIQYRTRGKMIVGSAGSLLGSLLVVLVSLYNEHLVLDLLLAMSFLTLVVILYTNKKILEFCAKF